MLKASLMLQMMEMLQICLMLRKSVVKSESAADALEGGVLPLPGVGGCEGGIDGGGGCSSNVYALQHLDDGPPTSCMVWKEDWSCTLRCGRASEWWHRQEMGPKSSPPPLLFVDVTHGVQVTVA